MRWLCAACVCLLSTSPSVAKNTTPDQAPRQLNSERDIADVRPAEHHGWLQHLVRPGNVSIRERRTRVLGELRDTLDVLQVTWYELSLGRWPTSIDWTGAVLNTHLVATLSSFSKEPQERHSNRSNLIDHYFAQASAYYYGEHAASLREQAYDDMLWVVLSWLESVKFIDSHSKRLYSDRYTWHGSQYVPVFARRAWSFYNITTKGWTTDLCGGGVLWNPRLEPYKNAITNQLYIAASIGMYLHFPDVSTSLLSSRTAARKQYLVAAIDAYDWLTQSNMTNRQGLYVDGFHISGWNKNGTGGTICDRRNEMVYSYNQGVLLSGLRGLWQATGQAAYLYDGHHLVRNTIAATGWLFDEQRPIKNKAWHGLGRAGIIEDCCDSAGRCDQNGHAFKSIYFHHLSLFCQDDLIRQHNTTLRWHLRQCKRYTTWVAHNAHAALHTRDARGRIGTWWGQHEDDSWHVLAVPPLLPDAVDYRNVWTRPTLIAQTPGAALSHDPNSRGRGRTVESHAGGVAALRCLLGLLDLDDIDANTF